MSSGKKIRMRAILKENMTNYISLERLINVDFGDKNMNCRFFFNSAKENCENDHASFNQINELIGIKIWRISVKSGLNVP